MGLDGNRYINFLQAGGPTLLDSNPAPEVFHRTWDKLVPGGCPKPWVVIQKRHPPPLIFPFESEPLFLSNPIKHP
jgi:hypothetical protein